MKWMNRNGSEVKQNTTQTKALTYLYQTKLGRIFLSLLIKPPVSHVLGFCLNLPISKLFIKPFVSKNSIYLSEYEDQDYRSYNDFFIRKIKKESRPIDNEPNHLIAPCDSKVSAYKINNDSRFMIKNTLYSMESLLRSKKLASRYEGGTLLVFRLTVDDYHRYCYVDNGTKSKNYRIPGVFHTVNPLANDVVPIYKENTREFTLLKGENHGTILIMEVGAMLVGKIVNYHEKAKVTRGQEKGRFEFGGSTVILCIEKGKTIIDNDIWINTLNDTETIVKMGEKIGYSFNP